MDRSVDAAVDAAPGAARRLSTNSSQMAQALLGCRKPKWRERRRPYRLREKRGYDRSNGPMG